MPAQRLPKLLILHRATNDIFAADDLKLALDEHAALGYSGTYKVIAVSDIAWATEVVTVPPEADEELDGDTGPATKH